MNENQPQSWLPQPGGLYVSKTVGRPGGLNVAFLHGLAGDRMGWLPIIRALDPLGDQTRIELPGHGKSPRRFLNDFEDLVGQMAEAFLDACPSPVHLIGHSLGGALALGIAARHAERVKSLTLIAPAGLGNRVDGQTLRQLICADTVDRLAPNLRRLPADPSPYGKLFIELAMATRSDPQLRAYQADMARLLFHGADQIIELRNLLQDLTIRTTLIWGRSDRILPLDPNLSPPNGVTLHILDDIGHLPHIECPDKLAPILLDHFHTAENPMANHQPA